MLDKAATCRTYVVPKLELAGWKNNPHDIVEQKTFTDGRIVPVGRKVKRRPTCKNIVIARVINSMTEFKPIIGRGTRVRDDYNKYFFTILDYREQIVHRLKSISWDSRGERS